MRELPLSAHIVKGQISRSASCLSKSYLVYISSQRRHSNLLLAGTLSLLMSHLVTSSLSFERKELSSPRFCGGGRRECREAPLSHTPRSQGRSSVFLQTFSLPYFMLDFWGRQSQLIYLNKS